MTRNAISKLKFDAKTAKRATWEAFEFSVPAAGSVAVSNLSYGENEVDDHTHAVNVEAGVPVGCSCKADEYQPGACKHRVAVAIHEPVLEAAADDRPADGADETAVATDGGAVVDDTPQGPADETTHAAGCDNPDCEGLDADADRPLLSFECWDQWAAYDEAEVAVRSASEVDL